MNVLLKPDIAVKYSNLRLMVIVCFLLCTIQSVSRSEDKDAEKGKTLYVISTAHLDTQWRWTIQDTINDHIKKTLDDNFELIEKYPDYSFSFEGAFRYMLMKEYYPERYSRLSDYIARGRWHLASATLENGDMNVVSPESLIRQTLIGNNFYEDEFGKRATDVYMPDCFGFAYTMPSWMSHCGLNGFCTQKLSWGCYIGVPFNMGLWQGPDGNSVVAVCNPDSYSSKIKEDLSNSEKWLKRIDEQGEQIGLFSEYKLFGTGDTGGAPEDESCSWLQKSIDSDGPVKVVSAGTDELYNTITPEQKSKMKVYDGEMVMTRHGVGGYTGKAIMKRWNRKNELLADSAERVAVYADYLKACDYPDKMLSSAWIRFLWHSFHDDITGASIPEAYKFSCNDEILSMNQFASILTNSVGALAQMLDTDVKGQPLVVYNPLSFERTETIEASVVLGEDYSGNISVYDGNKELPTQVIARDGKSATVAFIGTVPSVGLKVFDVRHSSRPYASKSLKATVNSLENEYLRVSIDNEGNIASIFDKVNKEEVLSEPCRIELLPDYSEEWPAWEIQYKDITSEPYGYVKDVKSMKLTENGPVRATIEIVRVYGDSTFIQKISLASTGLDAEKVKVENLLDWRTTKTLLKTAFPFTVSNEKATYDLGMGTIQRSNNYEKLYEVPAQQWVDLASSDRDYGVSVLSDCKYGWDKPTDNVLRLTLIHSPGVNTRYVHGSTQDVGQHKFTFAIVPHHGSWTSSSIPDIAAAFNQPAMAFQSVKHASSFGSELSLVQVSDSQALVKAVKKAERTNQIIVRVQELYGKDIQGVELSMFGNIVSASVVDGCERYIEDASVVDGKVVFDLTPYQPKTFALTLDSNPVSLASARSKEVNLPYNIDVFSFDSNRSDGNFNDKITYPSELIQKNLVVDGVNFKLGDISDGKKNALECSGQEITLGQIGYKSLYLLAAARGGDAKGDFVTSSGKATLGVQDYNEKVVNWGRAYEVPYLKHDQVAWVGTHTHSPDGNIAYEFCNMYIYKIDLAENDESVTLPDNKNIVIFAASLANRPAEEVAAAVELYDSLPYIPELAARPDNRPNLALNKPVWADSTVNGEIPAMAVDGTIENDSKWCAKADQQEPHWLVVDLQDEYLVDKFIVKHAGVIKKMLEHGQRNSRWNTKDFKIQTSPDGRDNWKDLVAVEDNTEDITVHKIYQEKLRYVRLYITDPARDEDLAARIFEFEIYGQKAEAASK